MKPYAQLTRLGQLRRLRKLAETALVEYGLSDANLKFQHYEGNVIFRADMPGKSLPKPDDIFVPNRYNLRILSMNDPKAAAYSGKMHRQFCSIALAYSTNCLPVILAS